MNTTHELVFEIKWMPCVHGDAGGYYRIVHSVAGKPVFFDTDSPTKFRGRWSACGYTHPTKAAAMRMIREHYQERFAKEKIIFAAFLAKHNNDYIAAVAEYVRV